MGISNVKEMNTEYTKLYSKMQKLSSAKKISIKVFDSDNNGKLSLAELKSAQQRIKNTVVNYMGDVEITDFDKNNRKIKQEYRLDDGTFVSQTVYKYNKQGQVSEAITFNAKKQVSCTTSYEYHSNGKVKTSVFKASDGITMVEKYNPKGNYITE